MTADVISPPCPHCHAVATKADGAGGFDCDDCGYWFTPGITESNPDSLNLKLYIAQHYPRVEDQLEARGFDVWFFGKWRLNVEPSWMFEVTYYEKDSVWNFRITWMTEFALIHFENYTNAAALMFDIDSSLRKYQGRRYVTTSGDDIVVENAASMPLAYGLMEDDSDFYQPALPFDPAISLGQATQRKLPYEPPLERSYAPAPSKWTPPPKVYKQDPDDIDPWDYINAAPNCGERRITTSFTKITWHDPPDEDYDEEHGWKDEAGEDLSVDEFDDEGTTPVDKAVKWLRDKGAQDTGNDDWYDSEGEQDMRDGSTTTHAYHLVGYTEEELAAIYDRIVTNRRRWRQESVWSKLFGEPVKVPHGTVVRSNTDNKFDVEYTHDPNLNKWFFHRVIGGHIFPVSYDAATSLYHCRVLYPRPSGMVEREVDIPYKQRDWEPSQKPVAESAPDDPMSVLGTMPAQFYRVRMRADERWKWLYSLDGHDWSSTESMATVYPAGQARDIAQAAQARYPNDEIELVRTPKYIPPLGEAADPDDPDAFMTRFYRGKPIKKVEVYGRRWWCRGPGNTYHSVQILVDGQHVATIDFVYGAGDQYMWTARDWLSRNGYLMAHDHREPLWRIAEKQGFQFVQDVMDVKRKRDL